MLIRDRPVTVAEKVTFAVRLAVAAFGGYAIASGWWLIAALAGFSCVIALVRYCVWEETVL